MAETRLPVFLADNHAETFGWISRKFDPDERHRLVLVDAHSDATMAERSEEIREGLRRVPSVDARARRINDWRAEGRIQAFNWIEPLMPRPVDHVFWLASPELNESRGEALRIEATGILDGRLEVEPRSAGSFSDRWTVMDLVDYEIWRGGGSGPVILALDLDFFAGMEAPRREAIFERIWQRAMDWPGLAGVAIAVSRPWLGSEDEADSLIRLACAAVSRTRGALLEIDATLDGGRDDSLEAEKYLKAGIPVPRWDLELASETLRRSCLDLGGRLRITDRQRDWRPLLARWKRETRAGFLRPEAGEEDCDGVWRFPVSEAPVLRVSAPSGSSGRVRWFALEAARDSYDLLPRTGLGKSFSSAPGRWIYEKRRSLGETTDFALPPEIWKADAGPGQFRISAELETPQGWLPVVPIEVRLSTGSGFSASLSECFGMPYVFGIAGVGEGDLSGVETGWGSDCSNFLIHAWRRNAVSLAWGDPGRLRAQLVTRATGLTTEAMVAIDPGDLERGVMIDFGQHVAAIWEDREPRGSLGGNDLVVHHLGGVPEIVSLETLARGRPPFALRVPRVPVAVARVKVAGDVVLAGDGRWEIEGFEKGEADFFLANLEGVPSLRDPARAPRYDFRFPPDRLDWLRDRGIDAVSLANNHAGDAGRTGLLEAIAALRAAGIATMGAGENAAEACTPWRPEPSGTRIAVFGVCLVDTLAATEDQAGVAVLPDHARLLEAEIRKSRAAGETVMVMVHGGNEYQTQVNAEQRRWSRWLVARGARFIAGAHPHVVQRTEIHGGAVIAHSLGNAVYPKALKGADSGELRVFRIPVDR